MLKIQLLGLSDVTMTQGVEQALIEEVPGVIGVQLIKVCNLTIQKLKA